MADPGVSVCLPGLQRASHPGARSIREASALLEAREGLDYEILVCDDGSTDATPRILAEPWRAEIPRSAGLHERAQPRHPLHVRVSLRPVHPGVRLPERDRRAVADGLPLRPPAALGGVTT